MAKAVKKRKNRKPKPYEQLCSMFLRRIPTAVRDQFKSACALNQESMTRVFIRMMRKYTKRTLE